VKEAVSTRVSHSESRVRPANALGFWARCYWAGAYQQKVTKC
jgi:hypothetical protein